MGKKADLTNQRFSRLLAIEYSHTKRQPDGTPIRYWKCQCDCGNVVFVPVGPLRSGNTHSCGCYAKEKQSLSNKKHGRSKERIFRVYMSMVQRCVNPNDKGYKNYGARGITVCDRWLESFQNFIDDMGERPEGLTIDRKDNNLGYNPVNCEWRSTYDQSRNRRNNRRITINGVTKCMVDWAEEYGIDRFVIKDRICKLKWDPVRAVTTPYNPDPKARAIARSSTKQLTINGVTKSLSEWADEYNQPAQRIHQRIFRYGWEPIIALTTPTGVITRWNKSHSPGTR